MIKEDYVSFEVAKLLKDKGFNEQCSSTYDIAVSGGKPIFYKYDVLQFFPDGMKNSDDKYGMVISAPTNQMAMKWLREVHGLSVETFSIKGTSNICPVFWKCNVVKLLTQDRAFNGELVGSYEEAVEAALKYSLKNLI